MSSLSFKFQVSIRVRVKFELSSSVIFIGASQVKSVFQVRVEAELKSVFLVRVQDCVSSSS